MYRRKALQHKNGSPRRHSHSITYLTVAPYVGMIQIRYTGPGGILSQLSVCFTQTPRYFVIHFTLQTILPNAGCCQDIHNSSHTPEHTSEL